MYKRCVCAGYAIVQECFVGNTGETAEVKRDDLRQENSRRCKKIRYF